MWIDIEQIDIGRLAIKLSAALDKWIADENSYKSKTDIAPLFIVQCPSHFEIALTLRVKDLKRTAIVGYEAGYQRYTWSPYLYEEIADSIVFDTLAGDYPILKADFSEPDKIVWAGGKEAADTKAQSIGDFLSYYENLNERAKERIWISKDFPLKKLL